RLVLVLLTHTFYRVRVIGRENVPQEGGALLIPNHVSFVDGLFLLAAVDRPIRMIVDASYFNHALFKPFMRAIGAIPISASGGPLPPHTPVHEVRGAVQELEEPAWTARKVYRRPLHHGFIRAMRQHPFRPAVADLSRPRVSGLKALAGAVGLARALRPAWQGQ